MILSVLLGVLSGLLIGGRFRIFATIPVQVLALLMVAIPAIMGEASIAHQAGAGLMFCLALQAGYVLRLVMGPVSPRDIPARAHEV